jgi:hypothetical protein
VEHKIRVLVGDPGVRVGLLEAERVERHRESGRRVGLQVAEDSLRVLPLPREQVRGPDGITRMGTKAHEVHRPDVLRRTVVSRTGVEPVVVPAAELAVIVHPGSLADVDRAYGALAAYVASHALQVDGPIREHYLIGRQDTADENAWRTEICWPIFSTGAAA